MIRIGDTILNEEFIAAIRPANDDGFVVPVGDATRTIVSLSSGKHVITNVQMVDVIKALECAGFLAPEPSDPQMMFNPCELEELKARFEQGYRFAAKDGDGEAYVYTVRPTKGTASWINDDRISVVRRLRGDFNALSFSDSAPLDICKLLDRLGVEA